MFRAIKRLFIWMGLMAEQATETDAINQAVVERGIRDSKAKADKAHYANGQLAAHHALQFGDRALHHARQVLERASDGDLGFYRLEFALELLNLAQAFGDDRRVLLV